MDRVLISHGMSSTIAGIVLFTVMEVVKCLCDIKHHMWSDDNSSIMWHMAVLIGLLEMSVSGILSSDR